MASMKLKQFHTTVKAISLSMLMAFIVLTSCNVRKGIQTLLGNEINKQLLPSKSIQNKSEYCFAAVEAIKTNTKPPSDFQLDVDLTPSFSWQLPLTIANALQVQFSRKNFSTSKIALYLLFKQLKTHH